MRYGPLFVLVAICVLPADLLRGQASQSSEPIGRVTAAFGVARVESPDGAHKGDLNTLITNGDRIRTNGGGVTVLLASRVVLKIDHDTTISLSESPDQLNVVLERGTVHVFVGERPLAAGNVCVQDPHVRAETARGVFLASYDPQSRKGYYACEHSTLTVQSGDGTQTAALAPDRQLIIEDGKFNEAQELDRVAFNDHKVSLERLGQAVKAQGAETFRLRSRMFDTQLAINQLSEAGWIDQTTLQAQAQQKASKKGQKKGDSSNNADGDSESSDKTSDTSNTGGDSKTLNEEPAAPTDEPARQQKPAPEPAQPAADKPVLTDTTPTETPPAIEREQPVMASNTESPPPLDLQVESEGPGNNGRGNAFGLDKQLDADIKPNKDKGPKHEFRLDHPGNGGNGNGNGDGNADAPGRDNIAPAPQNDLSSPPRETPAAKIDLDLPQDNNAGGGGAPAPKLDLGLDGGGKAQQPKLNLSDSATPAPKIDLEPKGSAGAPAKVDLGSAGGATKGVSFSGGGGGAGGAPKIDTAAPAPKIDLGGATPAPKLDLGGATPAPKIDLAGATPAPKIDLGGATPAPKIDLGGSAAPTPKIDLGGSAAPAPRIDLGGATPAPKIDLGAAAPAPKLDVTKALDAPAPKIEIEKAPAAIDIKTSVPAIAPKLELAKPAAELPAKIDIGGEIAAPKLDLAPRGDVLAPPAINDVAPKPVTDSLNAPLAPTDIKLDAPPAADVTNDAITGAELPTPKDLGLDVTKDATDATADAVKDAASEVTKKLSSKERRRRDRTSKTTTVTPTPAPAPPTVVAPAPPPPDTTAAPAPTAGGSGG